jgi:hypothetical protein
MLCQDNTKYLIKKAAFRAKTSNILHTKTALAAKGATFFETDFCFVS